MINAKKYTAKLKARKILKSIKDYFDKPKMFGKYEVDLEEIVAKII